MGTCGRFNSSALRGRLKAYLAKNFALFHSRNTWISSVGKRLLRQPVLNTPMSLMSGAF
jgi:hypothetical protein